MAVRVSGAAPVFFSRSYSDILYFARQIRLCRSSPDNSETGRIFHSRKQLKTPAAGWVKFITLNLSLGRDLVPC
jgi:hypothetical protein